MLYPKGELGAISPGSDAASFTSSGATRGSRVLYLLGRAKKIVYHTKGFEAEMNRDDFVLGHAPAEHRADLSDDSRTPPRSGGVFAKAPQPPANGCHHFVMKDCSENPPFSMFYVLPIKIPEEP